MSTILLIIGLIGIAFFLISICLFMTIMIGALRSRDDFVTPSSLKKFAVVIPAHNESALLGRTLESLSGVDYPKHLYEVFVIADNCSDDTAEIARNMRVQCLERFDSERRGKGYALQWFFDHLAVSGMRYEAFLVVDADTLVSSNILKAPISPVVQQACVKYSIRNSEPRQFCNGCDGVPWLLHEKSQAQRIDINGGVGADYQQWFMFFRRGNKEIRVERYVDYRRQRTMGLFIPSGN
jgi:cellulose synthase/poly-beta-1,6-N-acetylglucosamine synthase-like glycosyltransferase